MNNAAEEPAQASEVSVKPSFNPPANGPGEGYLRKKRTAVFNQPFKDAEAAANFVAPVHEKDATSTERLIGLFSKSFLTKHLDTA